jgi:TRAP-type C4-dicarboxylate transport system permease large subunit
MLGAPLQDLPIELPRRSRGAHPPVAILFVGYAVGRVTIEQVVREIWPFYAVMFIVLMLVTYIPSISLWLPRLLSL